MLEIDRLRAPPAWLAEFFQDREPEFLIRTFLRFDLVTQAIDNTLLMIKKVCGAMPPSFPTW